MEREFSIIIPAWNRERFISKCLDSALNQTFKGSYEIIVCLGLSQDNTEKIVNEYCQKYKNIRLVKCNKIGTMLLRLEGVKASVGRYIAFLDVDDMYESTYLETMHREIIKGYDVVNCSFYINRNNKITKNKFTKKSSLNSSKACKALLSDTYMRAFVWSKVYRRELFDFNKIVLPKTKEQLFEDTMFMFELFSRCKTIRSIKTPLYHYIDNPKSVMKDENPNRFNYHLSAYLVIKMLCENNKNKKLIKIFRHKIRWFKITLLYDAKLSSRAAGKSTFKLYRSNKNGVKLLRAKSPTKLDNYDWKQYVLDCLKPLE